MPPPIPLSPGPDPKAANRCPPLNGDTGGGADPKAPPRMTPNPPPKRPHNTINAYCSGADVNEWGGGNQWGHVGRGWAGSRGEGHVGEGHMGCHMEVITWVGSKEGLGWRGSRGDHVGEGSRGGGHVGGVRGGIRMERVTWGDHVERVT